MNSPRERFKTLLTKAINYSGMPLVPRPAVPESNMGLRQAAVLILLHQLPASGNGITPIPHDVKADPVDSAAASDIHILLTKRSHHLSSHAGEICFPGGRLDKNDGSAIAAALREAKEEIDLPGEHIDVAGQLPQVLLPSGFVVTPVLGLCTAPAELVANIHEVDEIFHLPLSFLLREDLFQQGSRITNNVNREFYFFDYKEYYIWGATAAMLFELAQRLKLSGITVPE